jgi:UDP-glucuronate decarboxylase
VTVTLAAHFPAACPISSSPAAPASLPARWAQRLARLPGAQVTVVDNLSTGDLRKLDPTGHPGIRFIKCDVNRFEDISAVFYAHRFDVVFHYAAVVGVKRTIENPVSVLNDIDGIRNLLNLCKNTGVRRVFFSSSSEVYGEPVEFPQNEHTTPLNSKLPYAIVKNIGEAFLRSYQREYGLDYTIFRFFNTYGPKQSKEFVVSKFIRAALGGRTSPSSATAARPAPSATSMTTSRPPWPPTPATVP